MALRPRLRLMIRTNAMIAVEFAPSAMEASGKYQQA